MEPSVPLHITKVRQNDMSGNDDRRDDATIDFCSDAKEMIQSLRIIEREAGDAQRDILKIAGNIK